MRRSDTSGLWHQQCVWHSKIWHQQSLTPIVCLTQQWSDTSSLWHSKNYLMERRCVWQSEAATDWKPSRCDIYMAPLAHQTQTQTSQISRLRRLRSAADSQWIADRQSVNCRQTVNCSEPQWNAVGDANDLQWTLITRHNTFQHSQLSLKC